LAGIYLHIPFCKQACSYCNFHFSTSLRHKDELISALIKEIEAEKDYLQGEQVHTIYFGGGTPSILSADDIYKIITALQRHYPIATHPEVTLEANPDDIDLNKLKAWKDNGINRLSIGIQSFFEKELKWMNRAHNVLQARNCIEWSQKEGITNLSIDLIYGSPLLTDAMWEQNMAIATAYQIPHLSCYALTVEEKTPLHKEIGKAVKPDIDPDKQAGQFLMLMKYLQNKGYEHYEVSNFALPGKRSKHNSSYWKGEKYLGLGPSAHSYNGIERRWNVANNNLYIKNSHGNTFVREGELLNDHQRINEYIMISLRTIEGMDLDIIEHKWGIKERERVSRRLGKYDNNGLVQIKGRHVQLTKEGMLMADGIASDLFEL
jgi:oxygen-independent coproporphyrinogen-3 oxidase